MKAKFSISGLDGLTKELERQAGKAEKVKREILYSAIDLQTQAKDNIRALGAINYGTLRDSIIVETRRGGLEAEIGPTQKYGLYVEFGARFPGKWPPFEALEDWARKHGIPVFLLARAIKRRGLEARPYLNPAFFAEEPRFLERLKKVLAA